MRICAVASTSAPCPDPLASLPLRAVRVPTRARRVRCAARLDTAPLSQLRRIHAFNATRAAR